MFCEVVYSIKQEVFQKRLQEVSLLLEGNGSTFLDVVLLELNL